MNCPGCQTPNRPGTARCRRCQAALPPSCASCGDAIPTGVELCVNCRTERIPAALGAELALEPKRPPKKEVPVEFPIAPRFVGRRQVIDRLERMVDEVATSGLGF